MKLNGYRCDWCGSVELEKDQINRIQEEDVCRCCYTLVNKLRYEIQKNTLHSRAGVKINIVVEK